MSGATIKSVASTDEPFPIWRCGGCGIDHNDAASATRCCAPKVEQLYLCNTCHTTHNQAEDAQACCEGELPRWTPEVLEEHGQIRLPLSEAKEAA